MADILIFLISICGENVSFRCPHVAHYHADERGDSFQREI
jgi:hypothetical protein